MKFNIKDNAIIICENSNKEYLLKELYNNKLFLNIKFFTKKEFFNNYFFTYKIEAISYLVNKYNFKVSIAKMYLDNLIFIYNKDVTNEKLLFLKNIYNELNDNNYLIFNNNFKKFITNKNVYVIGYPYLNNYEEEVFNELNVNYLEYNNNTEIKDVYECITLEDEVSLLFSNIAKLISKGIDIKHIKIMGYEEKYENYFRMYEYLYNIKINTHSKHSLYSNYITNIFLNNYDSDIAKTINIIKDYDEVVVNKIITICNKYNYVSNYNLVKNEIIDELKNTYLNNFHYENYVDTIDLFTLTNDDDYIFLINFNNGVIPASIKDESYITDNIKNEVNEKNTLEINNLIYNNTLNYLNSLDNLVISFHLKDIEVEYPSNYVNDLGLSIIKYNKDILNSNSSKYSNLDFAKYLDDYKKYNKVSDELKIYNYNLDNSIYNGYDNSYKGIDKDSLYKYLNNKLTLSYSSIDNYNKCAFRYYLSNILHLDKYEETFDTFLGSLFHNVLEKCFKENIDVDEEINDYIKDNNLTIKELFFVNKIRDDIKFAINVLNRQKDYSKFDKGLYEQKIEIDKSGDIKVIFKGFIDKLLYLEKDNETLLSIIDYKTGNVDIDLNYLEYGLYMQLPVYLYLVKRSNLFVNPKIVGFYIQYILNTSNKKDFKDSLEEIKKKNLRLNGFSNINSKYLELFDNTYYDSEYINGLKVTNKGTFYSKSKVLDDKEIDEIADTVENVIDKDINNILNANFTINPKRIGFDKDIGCKYCKFQSICYKKNEDYVIIKEKENKLDE